MPSGSAVLAENEQKQNEADAEIIFKMLGRASMPRLMWKELQGSPPSGRAQMRLSPTRSPGWFPRIDALQLAVRLLNQRYVSWGPLRWSLTPRTTFDLRVKSHSSRHVVQCPLSLLLTCCL